MAARSRDLKFNLVADVAALRRDLAKVDRDLGKLDGTVRGASRGFTAGFGAITRAAKYAGAAIGAGVVYEAKRSIQAFQESNKVSNQTQAVLKSTGRVANVTARDVSNLADKISRKTGVDDEAIASGENLLLTFKNVRNEVGEGNKVFDRATKAAVDLSAAGFGSLESTSKQLGKALNDPVKGMTALGRAGVTFTDEQKAQITALVKANDLLGAQKIVLGEVESQVRGSAQAQATWTDKLRVAAGNLEEDLGSGLAPAWEGVAKQLTHFARDIEPEVIQSAERISKVFGRKDLSLEQKFRLSRATLRKNFAPLVEEAQSAVAKMDLDDRIPKLVEDAAPKIADAMAAAAPRAAGAFVRAFKEAGPWGKLVTVAFLAQKMGAFGAAGSWAGGKLIDGIRGSLKRDKTLKAASATAGAQSGAAYSAAFNTASASGVGASAKGGKLARAFSNAGKSLGVLMGTAAASQLVMELSTLIPEVGVNIPGVGRVGIDGSSTAGEIAGNRAPNRVNNLGGPSRLPDFARKPKSRRTSKPTARGASVVENFYDPAGFVSPGRDHNDHVHVGATSHDELNYLMGVATGTFGLDIKSVKRDPARNRAVGGSDTSLHLSGLAFDAAGDPGAMAAFAKWIDQYRSGTGSGTGRRLATKKPAAPTRLDRLNAASALAALTPGRRDDRRAARRMVSYWEMRLRRAKASGNVNAITTAAEGLASARETARGLRPRRETPQDLYDQSIAQADIFEATGDQDAADYVRSFTLGERLKKINKALKTAKGARRTRLLQEKAQIEAELKGIRDRRAGEQPSALDFANADLAVAQLNNTADPATLKDDLDVLNRIEGINKAALEDALASGDPLRIAEAAGNLKDSRDAIANLTDAINANTAALDAQRADLTAALNADTELRRQIFGTQTGVVLAGIADMISGQIGGRVGLAWQTPGFAGGRTRY